MVIEHTFITTMEPHEALTRASDFLRAGGFEVEGNAAFMVGGGGWSDLDLRRGKKNPGQTRDSTRYPQQVRLEFDRGRVNVAASIQLQGAGGWGGWGYRGAFSSHAGIKNTSKRGRVCADMMVAITRGLELLLAHRYPPEQASIEWFQVEQYVKAEAKKAFRRGMIALGIFVALIVGLILFAVVMSRR